MNHATRSLAVIVTLMCLLSRHHVSAEVTATDRTELVNQHNVWRAKYHVPPLIWDETVARAAQQWADTLASAGKLAHRPETQYGENLWSGSAGSSPMTAVVDAWGTEVNHYDLRTQTCAAGQACGHFTQIVWRASTALGCGKATGKDGNNYVVCNYDPAGNIAGRSPFAS